MSVCLLIYGYVDEKNCVSLTLMVLTSSVIVVGILLSDFGKGDVSDSELYTYLFQRKIKHSL